ncbi:hypothetical protein SAOR_08765 [Salinisphaera orenii MK-B5]|uniref:Uncharacterized protein n=1 Tax=Salinisphaera orenii MK-B5 TaxID=856730 RepID=A0A423PNY9_9GAMM|nr:hypothetical protein [Salinisphaera orenii]ROO27293.1 hypothetical protein SAOR_08765 [Salinisphaera orenii MK-B5]
MRQRLVDGGGDAREGGVLRRRLGQIEQAHGRVVDQADAAVGVDHDRADLHLLDDMAVERGQILHLSGTFGGQRLALARPACQPVRQPDAEKEQHTEDAGLDERAARALDLQGAQRLLAEHADRRAGRQQERQAGRQQHARGRQRGDQQHAQAACDAGAGQDEGREKGYVHRDCEQHLGPQRRRARQRGDQRQHPQREIGQTGAAEDIRHHHVEQMPGLGEQQ